MRIVVGSDESTALTDSVTRALGERGHDLALVGPLAGDEIEWADVGRLVGEAVAAGAAESGVVFCWTGTGVSMAANKVRGVRAALCADAETAKGARRWNDANVLVMSLRNTSEVVANEMLDAWFATGPDDSEAANIAKLD